MFAFLLRDRPTMNMLTKSALAALALACLGGAALAAEACACCKDGEKMACCDKMKGDAAKPGDAKPAQTDHKH